MILLQRTCTPWKQTYPPKKVITVFQFQQEITSSNHQFSSMDSWSTKVAKLHASGATYSAIIGKAREPTVAVRNAGRFECINDVNDMVMIFLEILLVVPFLGIEFRNFFEVKCNFYVARAKWELTHMMVFVCCVWKLWRIFRIDLRTQQQQPTRVGWQIP